MDSFNYTLGPGWAPNPVFETAHAFLKAAEREFRVQNEKLGFLDSRDWFVVHHLSVLATELFVKSFHVTVSHGSAATSDGPEEETYKHAFSGHLVNLKSLPKEVSDGLETYLPKDLHALMMSLSPQEISRGRYPYENDGGETRFPSGDFGRKCAEDWLKLAQKLSDFGRFGSVEFGN